MNCTPTDMNTNTRNMWYIHILLLFICVFISGATCLNIPSTEAIVVDGPTVSEGDDIMLSCAIFNVSGERAKTFRMEWRRDGIVLTRGKRVMSPDPRYRITMIAGVSDRRDFVLHIDRVNRNDTGRYVCWVVVRDWFPEVPAERASSSVDLTVRYFPRHPRCSHDGFSDIFVAGTDVRFVCKVQPGEPVVRTRWKGPNDMVLFAHENRGESFIYNILTFQASSTHNGMVFTCEVSSDADVFIGLTSSCQVGPIEIIQGEIQTDTIYSRSSFSEYSVDVENAAFSELAPIPWTTPSTIPANATENAVLLTVPGPSATPGLDGSEKGFPIEERGKSVELGVGLAIVMMLLLISVVLNIWLGYKLRKVRSKMHDDDDGDQDNNIVPSICSGVSNEEYIDMQDHRNYLNESEFYSTIKGDTVRPTDVQYASPRSSIAGPSGMSPRSSVQGVHRPNSIYENLSGRPITPPRSKRKSKIFEEHIV